MSDLPKIAVARLKTGSKAPKAAEHPDANLLAAFVEQALTETERIQVFNHLGQCEACREIAALCVPEEVEVAALSEPQLVAAAAPRVPVGRRWTPWPVIRWGAIAATLGVLTLVVVFHPDRWKRSVEMSKATVPPAPVSNSVGAPQPAPATASPQTAPSNPPNEAWGRAKKAARQSMKIGSASNSAQELARNDEFALDKAKQHTAISAPPPSPITLQAKNAPGLRIEREEGLGGAMPNAGSVDKPSSPPPVASAPVAADGQTKGAAPQAITPAARSVTQSVAVFGGLTAGRAGISSAAKTSSRLSAQVGQGACAEARTGDAKASRAAMKLVAAPSEISWSISCDGKVQHSADGGRSFEPVVVAPGVKFRAIAALDKDVWAGGAGGTLFHSTNRGATWTQVAFNFQDTPIVEAITTIQIQDAQHLTVTTDSGAKWVSEDGGQRWRKQA